jgi:hypothetical protein
MAIISVTSLAQVANNTALVGNVVDASGLPVTDAQVTAVNEETKVIYPGKTNGEGHYSITFIVPGTYDITVEQPGFAKLTKTGQISNFRSAQNPPWSQSQPAPRPSPQTTHPSAKPSIPRPSTTSL